MVLQDPPEKKLAAYADLPIDTGHPPCGLVGRVHERIVEAKPIVEGVSPVDTLELVQIVASLGTMAEFGLVLCADLDVARENDQVPLVDRFGHATPLFLTLMRPHAANVLALRGGRQKPSRSHVRYLNDRTVTSALFLFSWAAKAGQSRTKK